MSDLQIAEIARRLGPLDRERLTGRPSPSLRAAYNVVSEDLCEMGLLNRDWSLSTKGRAVAAYLKEQSSHE